MITPDDIKTMNEWWESQKKVNGCIDIDNRIIKGKSGTLYRISPESITAGRYHEYQAQTMQISFNANFKQIIERIGNIMTMVDKFAVGTLTVNQIREVYNKLEDMYQSVRRVEAINAPDIIRYCAIFCYGPGEDLSTYNSDQVQAKWEDWSHIPIYDFFLLSIQQIPLLPETIKGLLQGRALQELIAELIIEKTS